MKKANPKSHDALVKWLIASFTEEFFAHYFPGVRIGKFRFIDKEKTSDETIEKNQKGTRYGTDRNRHQQTYLRSRRKNGKTEGIHDKIASLESPNLQSIDMLLMAKYWIDLYKEKVAEEKLAEIRKEFGMDFIETTISEHIFNQGKVEGIILGRIEGILDQIATLESLHKQGILSKKKMEKMVAPLRQKLDESYGQMPKAA